MKNKENNLLVQIVMVVIAILIIGGIYISIPRVSTTAQSSAYSNFGISFQYPAEWGIPKETFHGTDFSLSFEASSSIPLLSVYTFQDMNPQGTEVMNETFDQMIARFQKNDELIYQVKDISVNGINGKEIFYNSAVTGKPYHVGAYFPFHNNSYISLDADYKSVPLSVFDSVISTLKFADATIPTEDVATGMMKYSNNGIRFEYPKKLDTEYAFLNIHTSIEKIDTGKLQANGCYPSVSNSGKLIPSGVNVVNGIKFCSTGLSDVGAGQLYTVYTYTTFRNGTAYTIEYQTQTPNGCGVYKNSTDAAAPDNQKYRACLDALGKFGTTVVKPIQQSISTFMFAE